MKRYDLTEGSAVTEFELGEYVLYKDVKMVQVQHDHWQDLAIFRGVEMERLKEKIRRLTRLTEVKPLPGEDHRPGEY